MADQTPQPPQLHIDKGGSALKPKTSPQTIKALSKARVELWRLIIGGVVLVVLLGAYIVAMLKGKDASGDKILIVIGGALGALLGGAHIGSSKDGY